MSRPTRACELKFVEELLYKPILVVTPHAGV